MTLSTFPSKPLWIIAISASLGTAACGGSHPDTAAEPGSPGPSAGTPTDAGAASTLPPLGPGEGFRIDEGEFTAQPGEELTYCVRIPIPAEWAGRDLALTGWDWDLPQYTHHFFMAYSSEPLVVDGGVPDGPVPCDGKDPKFAMDGNTEFAGGTSLGDGKLLFGGGVGAGSYQGPSGYGRFLPAGGQLVTNHHVLNTSENVVTMHGRFNMRVSDAADVPHLTNELNCLSTDVVVQPHSTRDVTATCTVPFDLDLVLLASHAHNHLTKFETRIYDGQKTLPDVIYTSDVWNSPELKSLPAPIHLRTGQGLTFTCHYQNDQDAPTAYGFGIKNEMCATMNGYAFPVDHAPGVPPTLGTLIADNTVPGALIDTTQLPVPFF